ncbi:hypothetical protein [Cerasicoccus fimbriatus]|uniref:hypothetical protein n=1 Tax=Cerasicoccus fimbriatus TaxID=3014554 RepID=UPI0022B5C190|nr:hypothetical protein [Cerasicoccus sp. TK19100]
MAGFFKKLKQRIFYEKSDQKPSIRPGDIPDGNAAIPKFTLPPRDEAPQQAERDAYFVQIGLDFGTSFTKVVCRDIMIDKPWVYMPDYPCDPELPFLISSTVCFNDGRFSHPKRLDGAYTSTSLVHVKMALQCVGAADTTNKHLDGYRALVPEGLDLSTFVEASCIYLLAGIMGEVKGAIRSRFTGSVEGDQIHVNMAVPVASADDDRVGELFERVLRLSWSMADEMTGHPECLLQEVIDSIARHEANAASESVKEICFIYPEVSANVQGFIRSRSSQPGLYLFCDTGAGTVDQSLFQFSRKNSGDEYLIYLSAQVLPIGSCRIEELALEYSPEQGWKALEEFRRFKESGANDPHLQKARYAIGNELEKRTNQTIALGKKKLTSPKSINELRVIFGGGGHCTDPYKIGVMKQFDSTIFRNELIAQRRRAEPNFDRGMPDLRTEFNLKPGQERWSRRLSVAYGLSFAKIDLAAFRLPKDVSTPSEDEIVKKRAVTAHAPTKDDC